MFVAKQNFRITHERIPDISKLKTFFNLKSLAYLLFSCEDEDIGRFLFYAL